MYNTSELIQKIENGSFDSKFKTLYHNYNDQKERYLKAVSEFIDVFKETEK